MGGEVFPFQFPHGRYQTAFLFRTRCQGDELSIGSALHEEVAACGKDSQGVSPLATTIGAVPIYEFSCVDCGREFEELVGSHVGRGEGEVRCPGCGGENLKRSSTSGYAPVTKGLTPNQRRRLEDKRGTDRGGAKERFKRQRERERRG
jgi:putative FmdB family regulatory protein